MTCLTDLFLRYYKKSPFANQDRYHPVKRADMLYQSYLFPFERIKQGSNIVLWGAGKVGTVFYNQVKTSSYCNIVKWVDECAECYQKKNGKVALPETIKTVNVDYIVIAVKNELSVSQIINSLLKMGIDRSKIIWRYPKCLDDAEYTSEKERGEWEMYVESKDGKKVRGGVKQFNLQNPWCRVCA